MAPKLTIVEHGRDGEVQYVDGFRSIRGYWEFGGGDVVTILSMGTTDEWERHHAWAMADRARILRFVADEAIRQKAPTCVAQIDEGGGVIQLLLSDASTAKRDIPAQAAQSKAATFVRRYGDVRSMFSTLVLAVAIAIGGLYLFGRQALTVKPASGVPLGDSVRFAAPDMPGGGGIASLIHSTDPHLPNWTGRGGGETTSVRVMIVPLDGSNPRLVPVVQGQSFSSFNLSRIMGCDGQTLWFDAAGLYGVRLSDGKLVTPKDLIAANPSIGGHWWDDQRNMDVIDGKLHVTTPDNSGAIDVDPQGWTATPVKAKSSKTRFERYDHNNLLAPVDVAGLKDAAFLRMDAKSDPIALTGPDGRLRVHTSAEGVLVVSRLGPDGSATWSVETGLYRFSLERIFPGQSVSAFVGTRPPIPGKLSEPLVVLVDNATGKMTSHSMWR